MWDIEYLIKDLLKTKNFRKFINNQFKDENKLIIDKKFLKSLKIVETINGTKFFVDDMFLTLSDVEDYDIEDIRKSDIVLDIGACIGGFTLKVNRKASHVYCIEPTMVDRLNKNIQLNNTENITVIEGALGEGVIDVDWSGYKKRIKAMSLSEIIKLCGGHIDFLKIDCEGGEWYIKSDELRGIRRIEMEVHNFDGKHDFMNYLKMLEVAEFEYTSRELSNVAILVHAKNKFIK